MEEPAMTSETRTRRLFGAAVLLFLLAGCAGEYDRLLEEVHGHFLVSDKDCALRLTQPIQRLYQTRV